MLLFQEIKFFKSDILFPHSYAKVGQTEASVQLIATVESERI